jgi:hypothetical protein
MSTRATYQFSQSRSRGSLSRHSALTLYIHHDGYPSGGAYYFWSAHHFENQRGGMPTAFIRANDGAELTGGHDVHGDTEFRYTFDDGQLTVHKRYFGAGDTRAWHVIFTGKWWDFVNANPESIEGFTPLREVSIGQYMPHKLLVSRVQLVAMLEAKRAYTAAYAARWGSECGNSLGNQREVADLEAALAEYDAMGAFEGDKAQTVNG